MTSLNIPADAVRDVVAKAILESITPEVREKILSDAVAGILTATPAQRGYVNPGQSPLAAAFEQAVAVAVQRVAHEMVAESEEAQTAIRRHVGEAIASLCSGNYSGLPEKIGEAIGSWLQGERR